MSVGGIYLPAPFRISRGPSSEFLLGLEEVMQCRDRSWKWGVVISECLVDSLILTSIFLSILPVIFYISLSGSVHLCPRHRVCIFMLHISMLLLSPPSSSAAFFMHGWQPLPFSSVLSFAHSEHSAAVSDALVTMCLLSAFSPTDMPSLVLFTCPSCLKRVKEYTQALSAPAQFESGCYYIFTKFLPLRNLVYLTLTYHCYYLLYNILTVWGVMISFVYGIPLFLISSKFMSKDIWISSFTELDLMFCGNNSQMFLTNIRKKSPEIKCDIVKKTFISSYIF